MKNLKKISTILILFTIVLALSAANVHAVEVTPSIAWSQTYSGVGIEQAQAVIQTSDGGFLLMCAMPHEGMLQDLNSIFSLLKVDSSGNQQWTRSYSGTLFDISSAQCIVRTADGGYAVAAEYQSGFLLLKTNQSGDLQWTETYTGVGVCVATALVQTSDGGFALVGVSNYDPIYGNGDTVWLVKTDSNGDPQWNQTLGTGDAVSLLQTTDGGYAIAGQTENPNSNFMLLKVDSNGNLQWNRTYFHQDENSLCSVVQTSDGGYALGGWMWLRTNGGGPNIAIVKTNATGNMQWTQYYGAGTAFTMTKTSDGGFAIAGSKLVKVDAAGNEQWEIGLGEQPSSIIQTQDGGYAIAGEAYLNDTSQAWLAKIDAANTNQTTQPLVTPSPTIPEFPTWIILPLAVTTAVIVFMVIRKKSLNQSTR